MITAISNGAVVNVSMEVGDTARRAVVSQSRYNVSYHGVGGSYDVRIGFEAWSAVGGQYMGVQEATVQVRAPCSAGAVLIAAVDGAGSICAPCEAAYGAGINCTGAVPSVLSCFYNVAPEGSTVFELESCEDNKPYRNWDCDRCLGGLTGRECSAPYKNDCESLSSSVGSGFMLHVLLFALSFFFFFFFFFVCVVCGGFALWKASTALLFTPLSPSSLLFPLWSLVID